MTRKHWTIGVVVAAVLGLGVAGGGTWLVLRRSDPLARAEVLAAQGDLRGAQVELRNALKGAPKDAATHLRMARLQMKLADPAAAEKEFKLASAYGADRWEIVPLLAEAMLAQNQNYETLDLVPPRGPTPEATARLLMLRSIAQIGLRDVRSAGATLAEAQRLAPGRVDTSLIAARLAAARDDLAGTQAALDDVLRADPAQIDALLMRERLLTVASDRRGALEMATRAVASAPWSAMARMARANQLIYAGEDGKAQADVDSVLAVQPRFVEAVFLNAVLMARKARFNDAAAELVKLEGAASRFPQAVYYQALVATNLGQVESAAEAARRYVQLVPADPDGRRLLARAELAARRPELALSVLQRAVLGGQDDAETLDLLGRVQIALGNTPAAMDAFERAAREAPADPAILAHLGLAQMQQGRAADALATLERSVALAPGLHTAGAALVSAALAVGDVDRAEAALARLRAQSGETEAVGVLSGLVRLRRLDLEGARTILTDTVKAFPNSIDARLHLARVLVLSGNRRSGLSMLTDLLAREPANIPALNTYLPLLAEDRQFPPAIQALEAARKADPKQVAFPIMLGDALLAIGNPGRAVAVLNEARAAGLGPPGSPVGAGSVPVLGALARAQVAARQMADAKVTYRAILAAVPGDLAARAGLVELLVAENDLETARTELRQGLATAPGNLRMMTALVGLDERRSVEAALETAAALRRDPATLPTSAALKGDVLIRAGRPKEAAQAFLSEFTTAPSAALLLRLAAAEATAGQEEPAAGRLRTWLKDNAGPLDAVAMLAQLDIKAGRFAAAQTGLETVLVQRPNDAQALNNLAWAYQATGDARARATAQRAYLQSPNAAAADTLGWIMVREGAPKTALPLLERATQQRPEDPSMRWHLAVALKEDGQPEQAARVLRTLVAGTEPFEERAAARGMLEELSRP